MTNDDLTARLEAMLGKPEAQSMLLDPAFAADCRAVWRPDPSNHPQVQALRRPPTCCSMAARPGGQERPAARPGDQGDGRADGDVR